MSVQSSRAVSHSLSYSVAPQVITLYSRDKVDTILLKIRQTLEHFGHWDKDAGGWKAETDRGGALYIYNKIKAMMMMMMEKRQVRVVFDVSHCLRISSQSLA